MDHRPNILVIVPGGVGSGKNHGIPILLNLFAGLSSEVNLHVLSVSVIDPTFKNKGYHLHSLGLSNVAPIVKKWIHFRRFIRGFKHPLDAVHAMWTHPHGLMAYMASSYFKIPMINSLQGGCLADIPSVSYGGNRGFIKKRLTNFILHRATFITAETQFQWKLIPLKYREKASIIYYGIPIQNQLKTYKPIQGKQGIKLIHVANLTPIKDQITLLKLVHSLSKKYDVHLTIIGSDYYDGLIQRTSEELDLKGHISFLGQLPHNEVLDQLRSHDIMLHTSLFEGSCLAIIEAWSVGLLTIGTNVGILHDMSDVLCLQSEVQDVEGLVKQFDRLVNDTKLQASFYKAGIEWSRKHSMQDCVDRFVALYKQCIS